MIEIKKIKTGMFLKCQSCSSKIAIFEIRSSRGNGAMVMSFCWECLENLASDIEDLSEYAEGFEAAIKFIQKQESK